MHKCINTKILMIGCNKYTVVKFNYLALKHCNGYIIVYDSIMMSDCIVYYILL